MSSAVYMVLKVSGTVYSLRLFLLASPLILCLACCKKKKGAEKEPEPEAFDKQAMLVNFADQVILPAYVNFNTLLDSMKHRTARFDVSLSEADFKAIKISFGEAYRSYQHIS